MIGSVKIETEEDTKSMTPFSVKILETFIMSPRKKKKTKKARVKKLSTIRNRLFKLWSEAVRRRAGDACEYCGIKKGDIHINKTGEEIVTKIDAHHFQSRDIKDSPLKFDIYNGVAACPTCHKWGADSFHRCGPTTMNWLLTHFPERYFYVIENHKVRIDLDNRKVLEEIENQLKTLEHLNLDRLKEVEAEFPRVVKKRKPKIEGTLFEEDDDGKKESSSSSED
jgi:hypothetical protein